MNGDRPGKSHPLLLSSGKLVRIPIFKAGEAYVGKRLHHLFLKTFCPSSGTQAEGCIFKYGHMGPQGKILEYESQASFSGGVHRREEEEKMQVSSK